MLNERGERYMTAIDPRAELAPRDVVARENFRQMMAQGGRPVLLDATAIGRKMGLDQAGLAAFLKRRFPTIDAYTRSMGFDWSREPIPVTPAAHYWMGGIRTDLWARTSIRGLYAAGECARTGVRARARSSPAFSACGCRCRCRDNNRYRRPDHRWRSKCGGG